MTTTATTTPEGLTLLVTEEILVHASIESTFESLISQMGRLNEGLEGKPMPMMLEAFPGGRWYRDLGGDNGHLWGFVQSIKRPTLLEITGPLFMSNPVINSLQYRLSESADGTLIKFRHAAAGVLEDDHRRGVGSGWAPLHARVKRAAEAADAK
ncbi:MAG: SRPBCC domain-containing protein [Vicinamibacterales bacterium]